MFQSGRDPTHGAFGTFPSGRDLTHGVFGTFLKGRDPTHGVFGTFPSGRDRDHGVFRTFPSGRDPTHGAFGTFWGWRDRDHGVFGTCASTPAPIHGIGGARWRLVLLLPVVCGRLTSARRGEGRAKPPRSKSFEGLRLCAPQTSRGDGSGWARRGVVALRVFAPGVAGASRLCGRHAQR